jgi:hypothetical protein
MKEAQMLPQWSENVMFWKRYIDDGFGIWLHHHDPIEDRRRWQAFKAWVNDFHGLTWKFVEPTKKMEFMDIEMELQSDGNISFTLYEKPLNLYLYIPPDSAHPPGMLPGLVFGNVLRIFQLCSYPDDKKRRLCTFFRRLRARGYSENALLPIFQKAVDNANTYLQQSASMHAAKALQKEESNKNRIFLHLQYHPQDPESSKVQRMFQKHVMRPPNELPLNQVTNDCGFKVPVDQLTIAYHRAPNFGNLFSLRKIHKHKGPNVSSLRG